MAKDYLQLSDYEHFIPAAKPVVDFQKNYEYVLVESLSQLEEILPEEPELVGFDLETTGLNPEMDGIVGVCLSFDGKTGYYVPINHSGCGLPYPVGGKPFALADYKDKLFTGEGSVPSLGKEGMDMIYENLKKVKKSLVFNLKFDFRMMEFAGYDMSKIPYYDVQTGMYLGDTNLKFPSLKKSEAHYLGWQAEHFEEALAGQSNFYYTNPKDSMSYAITDALGTYLLSNAAMKFTKEASISGKIDNEFLYPLMKAEENPTDIDIPHLSVIAEEARDRMVELSTKIFEIVGRSFTINSPKQLGEVFRELGLDTGSFTKTGSMSVSKESLASIQDQHEVVPLVQEFMTLKKVDSSYLTPITTEAEKKDNKMRFSYNCYSAPTCRLAGGKELKNEFFSSFNIHSVAKPKPAVFYPKYVGEDVPGSVLGWDFTQNPDDSDYEIEGADPKANIRRAFIPAPVGDDDWLVASLDYSGQEIRIAALMSGEQVWIKAFQEDRDVHEATAHSIWGVENYDKFKRRKAKEVNFGALYGQAAPGFAAKWGVSMDEAQQTLDAFWGGLPALTAWKNYLIKQARKEGTVYNLFGRPRRVKWYLENSNKSIISFGYRTVINTQIQSSGADVLKIAMIKLHHRFFSNPEYMNDVSFMSTVHDEINFRVRKSRAAEIIPLLYRSMRMQQPNWPIGMECGLSIGNSWGSLFDFKINTETNELVPKYEVKTVS